MTIRQDVTFNAAPEKIFEALLDAETFANFTDAPAEIDASAGGAFSCFGGQIIGRNIVLEPHTRIIQAWRAGPWEEGTYSIVRFDINTVGEGSEVSLLHTGYPDGGAEHLEGGWHKMYWEPLKEFLG